MSPRKISGSLCHTLLNILLMAQFLLVAEVEKNSTEIQEPSTFWGKIYSTQNVLWSRVHTGTQR